MAIRNRSLLSVAIGATAICFSLTMCTLKMNVEASEKSAHQKTIKEETKRIIKDNNIKKEHDITNKKNNTTKEIQNSQHEKSNSENNFNAVNAKQSNNEKSTYKESNEFDYTKSIEIHGNVSENLVSMLNSELNKVSPKILDSYLSIGGRIILTSHDIATTYYDDYSIGSLMELHDGRQQILYISAREKAIKEGATHGMGHVLDSITGWNSYKNSTFVSIYNKEKETLITEAGTNYHKSNEREFFAETYYEYLINSERTLNSAPESTAFILNLIDNL